MYTPAALRTRSTRMNRGAHAIEQPTEAVYNLNDDPSGSSKLNYLSRVFLAGITYLDACH